MRNGEPKHELRRNIFKMLLDVITIKCGFVTARTSGPVSWKFWPLSWASQLSALTCVMNIHSWSLLGTVALSLAYSIRNNRARGLVYSISPDHCPIKDLVDICSGTLPVIMFLVLQLFLQSPSSLFSLHPPDPEIHGQRLLGQKLSWQQLSSCWGRDRNRFHGSRNFPHSWPSPPPFLVVFSPYLTVTHQSSRPASEAKGSIHTAC